MLDVQTTPREAQLDIDLCTSCKSNSGWVVIDSWMWSKDVHQAIPIVIWVACSDCNKDERKPKPWDT